MNSVKENKTDLNQELIKHPAASYLLRASGESMIEARIHNDDLLLIDSALDPKHGDIVIAAVNGEFTVKKLQTHPRLALIPMNPDYKPIYIDEVCDYSGQNFSIFGVVTHIIHKT